MAIRCHARAAEVTDVDGKLARLAEDMLNMYDAPGLGLAAPQVGVGKRLFVDDVGDGVETVVNPLIVETDGEWATTRAASRCLVRLELVRPRAVHLTGVRPRRQRDLGGGRRVGVLLFQHEIDHLDGVLFIDRVDVDTASRP